MLTKSVKPIMGRPRLPAEAKKRVVIGARFTPNESETIHGAIHRSGKSKPEWVRNALLSAAGSGSR